LWYNKSRNAEAGRVSLLEAVEVARRAVEAASDKQATDIVLLDVRRICSFADYFVICSGESERQIGAIHEEVGQALIKAGASPHHSEGTPDSGWVLMDFGDVIIHIFSTFERDYYQLEKLWNEAFPVVRIQ
jgi:ribosome-associated protein